MSSRPQVEAQHFCWESQRQHLLEGVLFWSAFPAAARSESLLIFRSEILRDSDAPVHFPLPTFLCASHSTHPLLHRSLSHLAFRLHQLSAV